MLVVTALPEAFGSWGGQLLMQVAQLLLSHSPTLSPKKDHAQQMVCLRHTAASYNIMHKSTIKTVAVPMASC